MTKILAIFILYLFVGISCNILITAHPQEYIAIGFIVGAFSTLLWFADEILGKPDEGT